MILIKSLKFWILIVAVVLFIIQAYVPSFPFNEDTLLKAILFILGLFNIEPEIKAQFGIK